MMFVCCSLKDVDSLKIDDVEASYASESCDELSDDVFTRPLVLAKGEISYFDINAHAVVKESKQYTVEFLLFQIFALDVDECTECKVLSLIL